MWDCIICEETKKKVAVVKSCDIKIWNIWLLQSFCVFKCSCEMHLRVPYISLSYYFVNLIFVSLNFRGANSSHFLWEHKYNKFMITTSVEK